MPSSKVDLEIIIPVLDESSNIKVVVEQLIEVFSRTNLCLSVIFVDNGSTDGTWQEIKRVKKLPKRDKTNSRCKINIKGIRLIRNLGQMRAIEVGLRCTSAPYVIVMDGDLQHPPEVTLELWRKRKSADTVAVRQILRQERLPKGLASQFFHRVISLISGERYLPNISNFRILLRNTIQSILASKQPIKVIRFLVPIAI
jgi:dolichol-phosphate mannosyltransferase